MRDQRRGAYFIEPMRGCTATPRCALDRTTVCESIIYPPESLLRTPSFRCTHPAGSNRGIARRFSREKKKPRHVINGDYWRLIRQGDQINLL